MLLTNIPANLQTDFLTESHSNVLPNIKREGAFVFFPAFIRQESMFLEEDNATEHIGYRYYRVPVPFTGQDLTDYMAFIYASYGIIRKYFYGSPAVQSEQILKGTFAAHQYAVRLAFPKNATETIEAVLRFASIKANFWQAIDTACSTMGCTRNDLPPRFTAEQMLAFATEHNMSADNIAYYAQLFSTISLNLLHNGRNWNELY